MMKFQKKHEGSMSLCSPLKEEYNFPWVPDTQKPAHAPGEASGPTWGPRHRPSPPPAALSQEGLCLPAPGPAGAKTGKTEGGPPDTGREEAEVCQTASRGVILAETKADAY